MACLNDSPMFSIRYTFPRFIAWAVLVSTACADTIVLKNGERVEGKITQENDQQVTVEVRVSASIADDRVIPRAEIERIEKVSPEIEAYKAVATIQPGANSLAVAQYDPLLARLQAFVTRFPTSPRVADVQGAINEFILEKKRVEGGEMKLRGQWLDKAEVAKEKVQLGGMLAFEYMKSQSTAGDGVGALNTFTTIEKNFPGAATMPESIELARQIVASLKPALDRAVPNQKALKAEKEKGFASAGPADRAEMMAAYQKEQAQADAAVTAAESAGQWPPFIASSEKSLTALLNRVSRESTRLAALPTDKMKKSVQLTNTAKQQITDGDLETAAATLKEATSLWPANELGKRLSSEVTEAQKAAKAAEVPATPTPTPTPQPPTPPPVETSEVPTTEKEKSDKPFYMTLPGAIGIVVGIAVVLAGINVFSKMKKKQEAE